MTARYADGRRIAARQRLIDGIVVAVARDGYRNVSVAHVLVAARCSRRTFYAHFDSIGACLQAAHDDASDHVAAVIASGSGEDTPAEPEAAFDRLATFALEHGDLARFWLCEAPAAGGPPIWERQELVLDRLVGRVGPLLEREGAGKPPPALPRIFAAATLALLRERVRTGDPSEIARFAGDAMQMAASHTQGEPAQALLAA